MEMADLKIKMLHHFGKYRLSIEILIAKLMNSDCFPKCSPKPVKYKNTIHVF